MIIPYKKAEAEVWQKVIDYWIANGQYDNLFTEMQDILLNQGIAKKSNSNHHVCSKKCRKDRFCLKYLQVESWENTEGDSGKDFIKDAGLTKSTKIGIKNLGATCYLNSLLQIWFYDPEFRAIIYDYTPLDSNHRNVVTVLQSIFVQLQQLAGSGTEWIDARSLVKLLELRPAIQQDALEFSKLLSSLLSDVLRGELSNRFCKQFTGTYKYTTLCLSCKSKTVRDAEFAELEVGIHEKKNLSDAILLSLTSEKLEGSNQYFCSNCNGLQNAIRSVEINSLPPTLHIQINRFVFNLKTMSKKKINTAFMFPHSIDMSKSVPTQPKGTFYDLSAVLLHRGSSASSGHYISRVYDIESGKWLDCNDEEISLMKSPDFQLGNKMETRSGGDSDIEIVSQVKENYSSTSAYMLVYRKRSLYPKGSKYPDVPQRILDAIRNGQDFFDQESSSQDKNSRTKDSVQKRREDFDALFKIWETDLEDPLAVFLDANSLNTAIENGIEDASSDSSAIPLDIVVNIDNTKVLCCHSKLDPNQISSIKVVSSIGFKKLVDMGFKVEQKLTRQDWCDICFHDTLANQFETINHNEDLETLKTWFNEFKKKIPFDGQLPSPNMHPFRSDVFCQHGYLSPDDHKRKVINKDVYTRIQKRFSDFSSLSFDAEPCPICLVDQEGMLLSDDAIEELNQVKAELKRLLSTKSLELVVGKKYHLLPKDFVAQWKQLLKNPIKTVKPLTIDTLALLCNAHKKLICDLPSTMMKSSKNQSSVSNVILITEDEWALVSNAYSVVGPPLSIIAESAVKEENHRVVRGKYVPDAAETRYTFSFTPDYCDECKELERLDYQNKNIVISRKEGLEANTTSKDDRPSKRLRTLRNKESYNLKVSSDFTIRAVKEMAESRFSCPPLYQSIYYNNLLCEDVQTLKELKISPGDEIEVAIFNQDDAEFGDDYGGSGDYEIGFGGTLLSGGFGTGESWSCQVCTLINEPDKSKCIACSTPKVSVNADVVID